MSEFKLCKNGHYYASNLEECPYCPKPGAYHTGPNQLKNTVLSDLNQSDWDHTRIETPLPTGTELPPVETPQTPPPAPVVPAASTPPFLTRTKLYASGQTDSPAVRKLVGWLVSYTLTPAGTDFRIYEGRNSVGADPDCDVVVPGDPAVSARHLTLLYRSDGFRFKDELSTNGTFVNDQMRDEGLLQDGDIIRVGNTVFKFKSAL